MKAQGAHPCPFCGSGEAEVEWAYSSPTILSVHCSRCGAAGPAARDAEGAIKRWNQRQGVSQ